VSYRRNQILALVAFGVVLVGLGLVLTLIGIKVVRERHWATDDSVTRTISLGPIVERERVTFVRTWDGADAQVAGTGLASLGSMLGVWGLGCIWSAVRPIPKRRPGMLFFCSVVLCGLGVVLLMPPWTLGQSATVTLFWCSLVVWIAALFAILKRRKWMAPLSLGVFLATVLTAILTPAEMSSGAILGFLAALAVAGHGLFLYPPWRRWAVDRDRAVAAQTPQ
jgi:hypothetical protein